MIDLMTRATDPSTKATAAYNAAADSYDHPALSFWERFGRRTVERLKIARGSNVLDVCCGSGASAIPAAEAAAPDGRVLAVDLAANLLHLGRAKARARGLTNIEFRLGDMLALGLPDGTFDVVICVFGIFFVPDMPEALRRLWRIVRPGGRLAITTWGPRLFEPANTGFWDAVRAERSDLFKSFNPWDRVCEPATAIDMLRQAGIEPDGVVAEFAHHRLATPDDWWLIVMGTGYRGTVEQLDPDQRRRVRETTLAYVRDMQIGSVETNVIYATASRDAITGPA